MNVKYSIVYSILNWIEPLSSILRGNDCEIKRINSKK